MEVANESNKSLSELWKSVQKDSVMEHRYKICRLERQNKYWKALYATLNLV